MAETLRQAIEAIRDEARRQRGVFYAYTWIDDVLTAALAQPDAVKASRVACFEYPRCGGAPGCRDCAATDLHRPVTLPADRSSLTKKAAEADDSCISAGAQPDAGEGTPIPMVLHCPRCRMQHIDAPNPARGWDNPPHRSHECQGCGTIWRPADVPTAGVLAVETTGKADTWKPADTPPPSPQPSLTQEDWKRVARVIETRAYEYGEEGEEGDADLYEVYTALAAKCRTYAEPETPKSLAAGPTPIKKGGPGISPEPKRCAEPEPGR